MYCVWLGLIYQHLGLIKLQLLRRTTIRAHPLDNTTFGSLSICGQSLLRKKAVNKYIKAPYVTLQTHSR